MQFMNDTKRLALIYGAIPEVVLAEDEEDKNDE
jgi:hypothetical protein